MATTLSSIVTLAHQQYGIRFQLTTQQLVDFANMIQFMAYNKDLDAFQEWNQKFYLGQDVISDLAGYVEPSSSDIGKVVTGSTTGDIGTLMNFQSENRINKWIVEPTQGAGNFTLVAGEVLTIVSGTAATATVSEGQSYGVSNGAYRIPDGSVTGQPPLRKFVGVTSVTDNQIFDAPQQVTWNSLDYGINLNNYPGRYMMVPYRFDSYNQTVTLVTTSLLEITQTGIGAIAPAMVNDTRYRWVYYKNPPTIATINDDASIILPERYRYEILYMGITLLADTSVYGVTKTARQIIEPLCERFWEDMGVQFQAFGKANDWISHGDTWDDSTMDRRYLGRNGNSW